MKKLFQIFFFAPMLCFAQETNLGDSTMEKKKPGKNTVYFEFLGNGGLYSVNYDRIFYYKKNKGFSWRAGFSYYPFSYERDWRGNAHSDQFFFTEMMVESFIIPCEINFLLGRKHIFEASMGFTTMLNKRKYLYGSRLFLYSGLCYRYQPKQGFFFKIGVMPNIKLFEFKREMIYYPNEIFSFAGMSFGYTFQKKNKL